MFYYDSLPLLLEGLENSQIDGFISNNQELYTLDEALQNQNSLSSYTTPLRLKEAPLKAIKEIIGTSDFYFALEDVQLSQEVNHALQTP